MPRLIIVIVILWLIYVAVRKLVLDKKRSRQQIDSRNTESMVQCRLCNLHVPLSKSITDKEGYFCSKEHQRKFLEQNREP